MHLEEFFDYKNLLMQDICKNQRMVYLITEDEKASMPNYTLPYSQVFPFEFVPETEDNGRTFVCFDIDMKKSAQTRVTYDLILYIWVFTHKSNLRTRDKRLRLDDMTSVLCQMLNGNRFYGMGKLELESVDGFTPIADYKGKTMVFVARDWNLTSADKKLPTNRKVGV